MKLWVVTAFRNRGDLLERSLYSIGTQTDSNFGVLIGDDHSDDPKVAEVLDSLGDSGLPPNWSVHRRPERLSVVGNQATLIRSVPMAPEDVLVFLDGDDRFAHPEVLSRLREVYSDPHVDLTYGSYQADPPNDGCLPARPIPTEVCAVRGGYRKWYAANGTAWNHLRTFRRRIFDAIPDSYMRVNGQWLEGGADYALMTPALELAGGRHRFIPETLALYTSDRPDAEWRTVSEGINFTHRYVRRRPPLAPLPPMEAT